MQSLACNTTAKTRVSSLTSDTAPTQPEMNFMLWNCRGANNTDFRRNFRLLLDYHGPTLVVLFETHMHDHTVLCDDFHFTNFYKVPATGQAGGIVLLWHDNVLAVENLAMTEQEVHVMIQVFPNPQKWLFPAIYASPHYHTCRLLWRNLMYLADTYKGPWLVRGDFNEILCSTEKFGGRPISNPRSSRFADYLNYCQLVDLAYTGSKYTWTNKRHYGSNILERLDRILANYDWITLFPEASVRHLPRTHSDHNPLLLTFHSPYPQQINPFVLKLSGPLTLILSIFSAIAGIARKVY
ncbi:PREDICTED: uncharacterized protein LOC109224131 [Nicotiana attenuata]|uniref:uncharacterized protein LOC109224131 n=1 Tax=Nicotiana attenuata TaxID=49451 RepID=UPI000904EE59|nr:PREDICTED: uncharacterized protein LOC109224131 [Nicotiana attenuata]